MVYTPEKLHTVLSGFPSTNNYVVAYSGGCDSLVLLHSLASLALPDVSIRAVYVDHGLQAESVEWGRQCVQQALSLDVPCQIVSVDASPQKAESPEAAARRARYNALGDMLKPGEILLTAHHADDQAETLLLQLLRGAGAAGLSAMAGTSSFSAGWHCRPLLGFSRQELEGYAHQHGLNWIEDPSNASIQYDRNFLRHEIKPLLAKRWPSWQKVLGRAASHQAQLNGLAMDLAALDFNAACDETKTRLRVESLLALGAHRRYNLLRYWIKQQGLPTPSSQQLLHVERDVLQAEVDRVPVVKWVGAEVRRYRQYLYAMPPLGEIDRAFSAVWDTRQQVALSLPSGTLHVDQLVKLGVSRHQLDAQPFEVRYRRGGEKIRLKGKSFHRDLKSLFQEAGVPPWVRQRIPLLYRGECLVAVPEFWLSAELD